MASSTFSGPVQSGAGFFTTSTSGAQAAGLIAGAGVPSIAAPQGTLYINTTASTAATRLYVNTTGSTTWAAFTAAA